MFGNISPNVNLPSAGKSLEGTKLRVVTVEVMETLSLHPVHAGYQSKAQFKMDMTRVREIKLF